MSMYTYLTSPRTGAVGGRTVEYRLGAPVEAEPRSFSSVTVKHETPSGLERSFRSEKQSCAP